MKGLLQSKIFRKNLKKWLCMYVGALLLLTTVVTYSKYISKFNLDDESRVTIFNVSITNRDNNLSCEDIPDNSGLNETKRNCTANIESRPTEKMTYEFTVTPDFEVKTTLVTTVYIPANFKIESLDILKEDNTYYNLYNSENPDNYDESISKIEKIIETNDKGEKIESTIISITRNIVMPDTEGIDDPDIIKDLMAQANTPKTYRVTIKYDYQEDTYESIEKDGLMLLRIGYSANQEK